MCAEIYHRADFIQSDPVQFPHRYTLKQDIEVSGLLYGEIILYLLIVIILSFLFAQIPLSYFRRRTLQEAIKGKGGSARPYLFRKTAECTRRSLSC